MTKLTILTSLTILCLFLLSFTNGEDHWKGQLQKRLTRAISPPDFSSFWNGFFWGQGTPPPVPGTTAKVTPLTTVRTTAKVTPLTTARTTAKVTPLTTARTTARVTSPSTARPSSSFTTFQNEALAQTNKYRAAHCAPNLILNVTLNAIARAYANKLVQIGSLVHSNSGYGENLYYASYGQPIDISSIKGSTPVDSWYSEVAKYNYTSPGFSSSNGHFTQLVWINTKQLGMDIACTSDRRQCYVVANYSPPGNYGNEYQANVKPGSRC